jgi:hypothetical protein
MISRVLSWARFVTGLLGPRHGRRSGSMPIVTPSRVAIEPTARVVPTTPVVATSGRSAITMRRHPGG